MEYLITLLSKAKLTSWLALAIHLLVFGGIAYKGMLLQGYNWSVPIIAIVPPIIFFYKNITEYDSK